MCTCTVVCQDLQPEEKSNFFFNFVLIVTCLCCWIFLLFHITFYIYYQLTYLLSIHYMPITEFNCTEMDGYMIRQRNKQVLVSAHTFKAES